MQNVTSERPRPHKVYRDAFYAKLMACKPQSVADFGCGSGLLLKRLSADGVDSQGIEPDKELVLEAEKANLVVCEAAAEEAPFADRSFDWVVSEFTVHHFADVQAVCAHAARIARKGVAFLDQWYDPSIPSQHVAAKFDRFCKKVDRASGMIHNDSLSTNDLLTTIQATMPNARIELQTMFAPIRISIEELQSVGESLLRKTDLRSHFKEELDAILDEARVDGMTDDGASMIFAFVE